MSKSTTIVPVLAVPPGPEGEALLLRLFSAGPAEREKAFVDEQAKHPGGWLVIETDVPEDD